MVFHSKTVEVTETHKIANSIVILLYTKSKHPIVIKPKM